MKKTEKILIRCDSKLKKELRNLAEERNITMSEIINKCIREELKASKVHNKKKSEKNIANQISKQDTQIVAGCIYHTQNILNRLGEEQQKYDFVRR